MNPANGPMADTIRGLTALGRYGHPEEIAEVVAALSGDAGAHVTGASINADGGFTA
jgi:3-oxoacyl-[acyl-carrier protein] reductase